MSTLKERLREDLTVAMRARDDLRLSTLRLALAAVKDAEVAGTTARELDDAEVEKILAREVRKRREAAEAFAAAGRPEQSSRENAEGDVLADYLPSQLGEDELRAIIDEVMAELGLTGMKAMGQVMKAAQARIAGRADGRRVSELVRARLSES
ncbi:MULTISPECIES: GatB/YqeY domain-containing protein [Parafrankia]|uniref:Glutamyl-tRNA amidotransferase n=1 Tax=Parafrankia soli TaxID=2599596 RepID=A0A1S1PN64_9ACTN|nr:MULTISPECIES: GatB/YqeY domain-containing protein [Parafrankia]OHV22335.1 glutamyl-tRNA amidotransferase [Parafrankia soli]TCJ40655.1 GatB/YqeY domain-containing protein [Parafrankia sp. BMG5.11]CAI7978705.1 GatB/YqeY domain-containing protein [Frankia sp. Hr75.2]